MSLSLFLCWKRNISMKIFSRFNILLAPVARHWWKRYVGQLTTSPHSQLSGHSRYENRHITGAKSARTRRITPTVTAGPSCSQTCTDSSQSTAKTSVSTCQAHVQCSAHLSRVSERFLVFLLSFIYFSSHDIIVSLKTHEKESRDVAVVVFFAAGLVVVDVKTFFIIFICTHTPTFIHIHEYKQWIFQKFS